MYVPWHDEGQKIKMLDKMDFEEKASTLVEESGTVVYNGKTKLNGLHYVVLPFFQHLLKDEREDHAKLLCRNFVLAKKTRLRIVTATTKRAFIGATQAALRSECTCMILRTCVNKRSAIILSTLKGLRDSKEAVACNCDDRDNMPTIQLPRYFKARLT